MEANLQRRIQRYGWDRAVPYYDAGWEKQLYPAQRTLLMQANPQRGEKVLETACGTGLVTRRLALAVGKEGEVLATDISENMVSNTRTCMEAWSLDNVRVERVDAEALEVPEGHFDLAVCSLGMMYFPDPEEALRQQYRSLRRGGRAATVVWGARVACGWNAVFPIIDARVETDVCPLFFQLGTRENLVRSFSEAGFSGMKVKRFSVTLDYADSREALSAIFAGGPVAIAYARFDKARREECHREYLDSIEPYRRGRGYAIPGEFVSVVGFKE